MVLLHNGKWLRFGKFISALTTSRAGGNPLFLEQCAAYLRESGGVHKLPTSLHDVILKRLDILRRSLNHTSLYDLRGEGLPEIEGEVCEWLDRLETGDYEDRLSIAEYLGMLQNIDSAIFVAKAVAGVPQVRNRRLGATIERFYSAGFEERVMAIEYLARNDRANAAYAAEIGGYIALEALRLQDAIGYLKLAVRYSDGDQRIRNLVQLGDAYLMGNLTKDASSVFTTTLDQAMDNPCLIGSCCQRLGHIAIIHHKWREAKNFLERARPFLDRDEALLADCDYAVALAASHDLQGAKREIEELHRELDGRTDKVTRMQIMHYLNRTKLQIALSATEKGRWSRLASECANTLVFDDSLQDLVELVETSSILQRTANLVTVYRSEVRAWQVILFREKLFLAVREDSPNHGFTS